MNPLLQTIKKYFYPMVVSAVLVLIVDALTNSVTEKYLFDSNFYLGIAERGFESKLRVAPFIYRYATPFLARTLHYSLGLSFYKSFKLLTYMGGISQLFGIYLIIQYLTNSRRSAYVGMIAVAFSMYNLKYLLFDIYRADALAYAIILLCTWFVFKRRFLPLVITTVIGLQVREFVAVPLLAFLVSRVLQDGLRRSIRYVLISVLALIAAIALPRLIIPVIANEQEIQLSLEGVQNIFNLLLLWKRDINLFFVCFAYFLPVIILLRRESLKVVRTELASENLAYLIFYSMFIFILTTIGGTDMERFASYFFLPMAVFVGIFAKNIPLIKVATTLCFQFIFNRIWLQFPIWDFDLFANFYGGWSTVINTTTIWRYIEALAYAIIGNFIVNYKKNPSQRTEELPS